MRRVLLCLLLLCATSAFSANTNRFIDCDVSTSGDGTSWETAWKGWSNIVWAALEPGDIVYISGGTYIENGDSEGKIPISASGTAGNPIRFKVSQEAGHNDRVILKRMIAFGSSRYVILDGAKDDSYTNVIGNSTFNVPLITNNINMTIHSSSNNGISMNSSRDDTLMWLEITNEHVTIAKSAVSLNGLGSNIVIKYCWFHDLGQDGITAGDHPVVNWRDLEVGYCIIERVHDDAIEVSGGGFDVHHSICRDYVQPSRGHPDGIVQSGVSTKMRVWNNILYDWNTIPIYLSPGDVGEESGHTYVYGNLVYSDDMNDDQEAAFVFSTDAQAGTDGIVTVTNLFVFNNSFLCSNGTKLLDPIKFANRFRPEEGYNQRWNLTNAVLFNNILLDGDGDAANLKGTNLGIFFKEENVALDWNIMSGLKAEAFEIVHGATWTDAVAFNNGTIYGNNKTNRPSFINMNTHDYRLLRTDTAARNAGTNLTMFLTMGNGLPDLDVDLYGNTRGYDGSWDIGAIEESGYITNGLLCWLRFEDDFSDGTIIDSSTNGAHMLRFGWTNDVPNTNFPTRITGQIDSYAAAFLPHYENTSIPGWGTDHDGDYGVITNCGGMLNLTQATIMCWGYFSNAYEETLGNDHNATFLDGGYTTNGTWHFGRYYSQPDMEAKFFFKTNTSDSIADRFQISFPTTFGTNEGQSKAWQHYCVTVDCSDPSNVVLVAYFQGTNYTNRTYSITNTANAVPFLTIGEPTTGGYAGVNWMAVGCWTHNSGANESPPLDDNDNLPNNGWMHGAMDDLRIYNRVLSANEIAAIYNQTESYGMGDGGGTEAQGDEEEPDPDPPSTNTVKKVGMRGRSSARGNVRIR